MAKKEIKKETETKVEKKVEKKEEIKEKKENLFVRTKKNVKNFWDKNGNKVTAIAAAMLGAGTAFFVNKKLNEKDAENGENPDPQNETVTEAGTETEETVEDSVE